MLKGNMIFTTNGKFFNFFFYKKWQLDLYKENQYLREPELPKRYGSASKDDCEKIRKYLQHLFSSPYILKYPFFYKCLPHKTVKQIPQSLCDHINNRARGIIRTWADKFFDFKPNVKMENQAVEKLKQVISERVLFNT